MTTGSDSEAMPNKAVHLADELSKMVLMHTQFGGTRMIDMLVGDPLPRIC